MQVSISINPEIFEISPGYRRAVIVAQEIVNEPSNDELKQLLRDEEQNTRQSVTLEDPRLVAWREAFQVAGIKTNKFRPSIDALVRRVLNGGELPSISTLVDIGTILSLRYVLPCGAHSLNDVQHGLELRKATGNETFTPFGSDKPETVTSSEIIFTDGDIVATSKWAWRQANHTIIRPETTAVELNIDALSVISDEKLNEIIINARNMIKDFLNVDSESFILDSTSPTKNRAEKRSV